MSSSREPIGRRDPSPSGTRSERAGVEIVATGTSGPAETSPPALYFTLLAELDGVGILGCGWLCDPDDQIREIRLGDGPEPIDLLGGIAMPVSAQWLCEAFDDDAAVTAKLGFFFLIPKTAVAWRGGLGFELRGDGGLALRSGALAIGRAGSIDRLIESGTPEDALHIAERAVACWRRGGAGGAVLPAALDRLLDSVHRRIASAEPAGAEIGEVLRVDTQGMLITGRIAGFDPLGAAQSDPIRQIGAVSLCGRRVALPIPPVQRLADGTATGAEPSKAGSFAVFAEVAALRPDERRWLLEITRESGAVERVAFMCPPAVPPLAAVKAALALVDPDAENRLPLFEAAFSPAVDALWAAARRAVPTPSEIRYGVPPEAPRVSLVVPLYGRIDLAYHQIACFSNDPEFRSGAALAELIYVLDDPRLEGPFERLCRRAHDIYRVPFRTLLMHRNAGFSGAVNAGAALASGAMLLLLNSDVLPRQARWIGQLLRIYRSLERCGILGCRLVYEDGSIQHAGMRFVKSPEVPWAWENDHPHKGLPTSFDRPGSARVPAVTGACLMVERELYRLLGGLTEAYVLGDFEDSDLCLKALAEGWGVYYTPEVELYHLERQSVAEIGGFGWRRNLTFHNMLTHARKWGEAIARLQATTVGA